MSEPAIPGGLNWDDILEEQEEADSEFAAIPANTYTVEVDSAEATTAQSGNKMIKCTLRVQGGPYNGRLLWTNIVFATANPVAMKFTLRKLRALGVTKEWLAAQNPSVEQIASAIEGKVVDAEVEVKPYNGENTNDVKGFKAVAAGAGSPAPGPAAAAPPAPPTTKKAASSAPPTPTPTPEPPTPAAPPKDPEPQPPTPSMDDDTEEPF